MTDPLAGLKDIHLPTKISWWPLATGWYFVGIIALLLLFAIGFWAYRWLQHRRLRRSWLHTLNNITMRYEQSPNDPEIIAELAVFLRRLIFTYFPSNPPIESGHAWLKRLNQLTHSQAFTEGPGKLLLTAPYQKQSSDGTRELVTLITTTTQKMTRKLPRRRKC